MSEIGQKAEVMRAAAHLMTQDGLRLIKGEAKVQGVRLFLTSWADLLREMSLWMETQRMANILPEEGILQIAQLHIEAAETYLATRETSEQALSKV